MQDFRKLRVWTHAQDLAVEVRRARVRFRRAGYGPSKIQMTRSAESIVHTIVEGSAAASPKEFARFLDMAIKSATELEGQVELARNYGILREHEWKELTDSLVSERRMLCVLRKRVLAPRNRPPRRE